MLTLEKLASLLPLVVEWAETQEKKIRDQGIPLTKLQLVIARQAGVKAPDKVRLLYVPEIPLPEHRELREIAVTANLITPQTIGLTLRYGIFIRTGWENDRRLVAHELAHTMQYERAGSREAFLASYLEECLTVGYPQAPLEQEAIAIENKITGAARDQE